MSVYSRSSRSTRFMAHCVSRDTATKHEHRMKRSLYHFMAMEGELLTELLDGWPLLQFNDAMGESMTTEKICWEF